jgi:hypothetical protein
MLKNVHLAHLTGTATSSKNRLFWEELEFTRPRRSVGQMFFKPYESSDEFVFCARHTLQPLLIIGLGLSAPLSLAVLSGIAVTAGVGCLLLGGLSRCMGNIESAAWWIDLADQIITRISQALVDLVVVPLTAIALATRSISSGLQAADVYDYDPPPMSPV